MSNTIRVYKGIYKNRLIAITQNKELIKIYMEEYRGLNRKEYEIEEEMMFESDIVSNKKCIIEWNGYYIPEIDICLIDLDTDESIDTELNNTIESLKNILILSQDVKKIKSNELESIIDTIQVLSKILNNNKIKSKLYKNNELHNSILFSDMDTYLQRLNVYEELKLSMTRWNI